MKKYQVNEVKKNGFGYILKSFGSSQDAKEFAETQANILAKDRSNNYKANIRHDAESAAFVEVREFEVDEDGDEVDFTPDPIYYFDIDELAESIGDGE
jgi:hypothetical protein